MSTYVVVVPVDNEAAVEAVAPSVVVPAPRAKPAVDVDCAAVPNLRPKPLAAVVVAVAAVAAAVVVAAPSPPAAKHIQIYIHLHNH